MKSIIFLQVFYPPIVRNKGKNSEKILLYPLPSFPDWVTSMIVFLVLNFKVKLHNLAFVCSDLLLNLTVNQFLIHVLQEFSVFADTIHVPVGGQRSFSN